MPLSRQIEEVCERLWRSWGERRVRRTWQCGGVCPLELSVSYAGEVRIQAFRNGEVRRDGREIERAKQGVNALQTMRLSC